MPNEPSQSILVRCVGIPARFDQFQRTDSSLFSYKPQKKIPQNLSEKASSNGYDKRH